MTHTSRSTQDFLNIKEIRDNVVIQDNGQMCMIMLVSTINFSLKSHEEQQVILVQFQQFINTLDFTLQIYIQSRRLNINPYLETLESLKDKQNNILMQTQLREYIEFIRTFTTEVDIMSKSFFVVVPYTINKLDLGRSMVGLFQPKINKSDDELFQEQRTQLEQRAAVISNGLARIGLRSLVLQKDDLVELFYHLYNPTDVNSVVS